MRLDSLFALHIPDGFLSVPVAIIGWVLLIITLYFALRQTRTQLGERQVPLMGILAAFVFAAQMINFPVAGGTSGHLLGGTLVAILLGPWAAALIMTAVIGVQALIFQDGGLLAIGFNAFNMGIITAFLGFGAYSLIRRVLGSSRGVILVGAAVGAWISVEAAAIATALQLAISNTSPLQVAFPAMVGVHALIGIGEALITVGALAFILQARPDLMHVQVPASTSGTRWVAVGLLIALVVVLFSPLASPEPDGLERVAEDVGFLATAQEAPYQILPDYTIPGVDNQALSTILAGAVGTLVVAGLGYGIGRIAETRRKSESQA